MSQSWALRSTHSWRLLELFERGRATDKEKSKKKDGGWLAIMIEDFWHAMEGPIFYQKNFGQL
ncbi:replication initiation protein, partial [Yersinia pseudotuberculosis]|nr:replication initiation protein [Yersinia pseudotuberculosis]